MDRIQAVRLFIRVVELGSFSKAATDLGIGQPSATKQVAQMEKQLGARLLYRSTHGVTPTDVGMLYYEKCKIIIHHIDDADSVAALLQSQVRGGLRVSTSAGFGRLVLAPLVIAFAKLNPRLEIDVSIDDRYVDLIEQGIDVAIRMGRLADSAHGARYLGSNPWVAVASAEYLERRGTPAEPAELSSHDALIYTTVQGDARWHFAGPDGRRVVIPVGGSLRSNDLSILLAAARAGMGIAIMPWYVANPAIGEGSVRPLLTDWSLPSQEIHAVYPSPRLVPAKVGRFVEWLEAKFGEAWWMDVG